MLLVQWKVESIGMVSGKIQISRFRLLDHTLLFDSHFSRPSRFVSLERVSFNRLIINYDSVSTKKCGMKKTDKSSEVSCPLDLIDQAYLSLLNLKMATHSLSIRLILSFH